MPFMGNWDACGVSWNRTCLRCNTKFKQRAPSLRTYWSYTNFALSKLFVEAYDKRLELQKVCVLTGTQNQLLGVATEA